MNVMHIILGQIHKIIKADPKSVFHLMYYSAIEAILVLSIPLASTFVINSVLAHAAISVTVLGIIVSVMFVQVTVLQVIKEYIIEKFQQKVFLTTGIEIAQRASVSEEAHAKYMNYFFDISAIQKFFPILLLDGTGLIVKIIVSMMLLMIFDPVLFAVGFVFFTIYMVALLLLGRNGIEAALHRSDAKHSAIYFLQHIRMQEGTHEQIMARFDDELTTYAKARQSLFDITIRQLALTFFTEGFIFSAFLITGGFLVINGTLPLGEFIAAEIVVVSITYALKGFIKQIDYIYDTIEGFYKVNKLSTTLGGEHREHLYI